MFGTRLRRTGTAGSNIAMSMVILVIVSSSVLQGYAESISRMQSSKPSEFNNITPSPMVDGTMSTNGWRPMISSSIAPAEPGPTKQIEVPPAAPPKMNHRIPPTNGPPKGHTMANRPQPLKVYAALPMQIHHPGIDLTSYVEDIDDTMRPRPRRQKKRPPFKTVDPGSSLGLIASAPSDPIVTFRGANSDSPFIRHVMVTEPSFSRHRPHPSSLRGAPPPAQHGLFQADPSQEMLPPTTAPQPQRPSPAFDGPPHLRGRPTSQHHQHQHHHHHHQPQFHGPSFYFQAPPPHSPGLNHQHHHQVHQQTPPPPHAYPAVARPAEPLPGSLLRPHKDRLTDSSAFRTGGMSFQSRPSPVQWPDSLGDGRVHFSVTSTPLVEERPSHWEEALAGRQEGKVGEKPSTSVGVPQRGPERGKPHEPLENGKGRPKPHREPGHGQHQVIKSPVEEAHLWGGVGGASAELHRPTKDPTEGSALKSNEFDLGPPPTRVSKKPLRGNVEGKRQHQGVRDGGKNGQQRPHENAEPIPSEVPREERPRPSKNRHNPNYRKKIENGEPSANINGEIAADHQVPAVTQVKVMPSEDVIKGLRGDNGGQRAPVVRKRRPKPTGNRRPLYTKRPVEVQETHQQQQEQYQPVQQYQQYHQQQIIQQQEQFQPQQQYKQQQNAQQQEQYQPGQQYSRHQSTQQQEQYQPVQQVKQQQNTQRHPQEAEADQYRQQVLDQEAQQQQQEVAEPQRQHETTERLQEPQPTSGQRPRKRGRRPTQLRTPVSDAKIKVDGENQLAPAVVRAEGQQVKWTAEARPRPIVRSRRPKPEVQSTVEPQHQGVTSPASTGEKEYSQPSALRKIRPTDASSEQTTSGEPVATGTSYQVKEIQEERFTNTEAPQVHISEEGYHREQEGQLVVGPTGSPPQNSEQTPTHELDGVPPTAESYGDTTASEKGVEIVPPTAPSRVRPQRIPDPPTTVEAAATTTEAPTTTIKPTSSAYGIRSRIRTGSRPRFSVKDYRERLNRLSQLSGRGRNGTEDGEAEANATVRDTTATGAGVTGPGRERWYPGRRQQQTLQEQQQLQQLQHQRQQTTQSRNEGPDAKEEKTKTESVRDRYRVRAPALRQRPTAPADTAKGTTAPGEDKQEEASTAPTSVNRYRSRYGGRFTTTTASSAEGDITTTENPTSRRRGILTTYGMRRPLPLRVRPGQTTTTELPSESTTVPMTTTTDYYEETTTAAALLPVISTTEAQTTTTTTAATTTTTLPPTTTTTEEAPPVVENEVAFQEGEEISAPATGEGEGGEEEEDGVDLKDGFIRPGQLVNVGGPVSVSVLTESGSEEDDDDEISPEQRVSDLTVWATTGQTGGGGKGAGRGGGDSGGGLVTFSAVSSYPAIPYVPRLVTMATEDPVLPLEAFFFGPSASGGKSPGRVR